MSDRIDTDQLLDRCADCGARARILEATAHNYAGVMCTECANSITPQPDTCQAAILWNQEQRRKAKAKQ